MNGTRTLALALAATVAAAVAALDAAAVRAAAAPPARTAPQRIVSINLCTDELLLILAERKRIKSVSFLAADPASSTMPEAARGLRLNRGRAEEILPLAPDLILAGQAAARPSVRLLKRLGYRVVELPLARSLEDVSRHVRIVARAIGEEARGETVIAAFEAKLTRLRAAGESRGPRRTAVLFGSNGVTSGRGTLIDSAIRAAGFANLAARLGLKGVGRVTLEDVIARRPAVLIIGRLGIDQPSLAARSLAHPALKRAFAGRTVSVPQPLWSCATPAIADAIARLVPLAHDAPTPTMARP